MPNKRRDCPKCEVKRWKSDFPDNFEDNICFFCFFKTNIEDIRQEIKTIKNIVMSSGEVNTIESPPVSNLEKNTIDTSTNDVSKQIHVLEKAVHVYSDMLSSFIRSLRPGNSDKGSENPTDFHLDSNRTRPTLTRKLSLGNGAERSQDPNVFSLVRNGTRPKPPTSFQIPVSNPFSVLEVEESEKETIVVGSSIIKNMKNEFVLRNPRKRKTINITGASISNIENEVKNMEVKDNGLICTIAGTVELYEAETNPDELLQKYRTLIRTSKARSKNVLCIGILPRKAMDMRLRSKAIFINSKLEDLCKTENVNFSNLWEQFVDKNYLFRWDGFHLNDVGDARLGRLLDTEVRKVLKKIKNASQDFRLEPDTTPPHSN